MRIAQGEKYQSNDWWSWWVWIEGTAEELRAVESATYTLHPTFYNPVRKVTDRRSKFLLKESGWGGFTIYARVDLKTGKKRNLKHELTLSYPEGHQADSVTIRINDEKETDPNRHAQALQLAIREAAPDATIERASVAALNVQLTAPTLSSVAKGIHGWLVRNPHATIDLLKDGQMKASRVTGNNVVKVLSSLKA